MDNQTPSTKSTKHNPTTDIALVNQVKNNIMSAVNRRDFSMETARKINKALTDLLNLKDFPDKLASYVESAVQQFPRLYIVLQHSQNPDDKREALTRVATMLGMGTGGDLPGFTAVHSLSNRRNLRNSSSKYYHDGYRDGMLQVLGHDQVGNSQNKSLVGKAMDDPEFYENHLI